MKTIDYIQRGKAKWKTTTLSGGWRKYCDEEYLKRINLEGGIYGDKRTLKGDRFRFKAEHMREYTKRGRKD